MIQIKQKDLKAFRKKQWLKQHKKCPVLKKPVAFEDTAVDHKHKRKSDPAGPDGAGLIRGVLQKHVNAMEGKVTNAYIRYGLNKYADLPSILRGLADYLEQGGVLPFKYIHPKEEKKEPLKFLNQRDFDRVKKYWDDMYPNRKFPTFLPKKKKNKKTVLNKAWTKYVQDAKNYHEKVTGKKLK